MISKRHPILTSLVLLLMSMGVLVAAFAVRIAFVPDVVPIASVEQTQSLWALELAFVLTAIENIAGLGAAIVLLVLAVHLMRCWFDFRRRPGAV